MATGNCSWLNDCLEGCVHALPCHNNPQKPDGSLSLCSLHLLPPCSPALTLSFTKGIFLPETFAGSPSSLSPRACSAETLFSPPPGFPTQKSHPNHIPRGMRPKLQRFSRHEGTSHHVKTTGNSVFLCLHSRVPVITTFGTQRVQRTLVTHCLQQNITGVLKPASESTGVGSTQQRRPHSLWFSHVFSIL